MREIAGLRSDYVNVTWPAYPNSTFLTVSSAIVCSTFGVPANLLVLLLSFSSAEIIGNYKYFIANLAFFDLVYCFGAIFQAASQAYYYFVNVSMNTVSCTLQVVFAYTGGLSLGCALPLTSLNRYLVIVKDKDEWFTRKVVVLICMTALLPFFYPIIVFLFAPYVVDDPMCSYTLYIPFSIEPFFVYVIAFCYPLLMFCNYKLYRVLSQHMTVMTKKLKRSVEQIKNEKSILKAIIFQGALPAVTAFPLGMMFIAVFIGGWEAVSFNVLVINDEIVLSLSEIFFWIYDLTPTIDALITLFVVKQYKNALRSWKTRICSRIFCGTETPVTPITPIMVSLNRIESHRSTDGV